MTAPGSFPAQQSLQRRRQTLLRAVERSPADGKLTASLHEVDAALDRIEDGTYGLCETCGEPIEEVRLAADPLVRLCLDHLTPDQQQALEHDLAIAAQIQRGLLPGSRSGIAGWEAAYHYEPARIVSGDYCDLFPHGDDLYFVVGDVTGKGVAAAMLMTHLHATLRALVAQSLPLTEIMERASRIFCESTLPTHFATMVVGRAMPGGNIEMCIAGHMPVLLARHENVERIASTSLPVGMFCDQRFTSSALAIEPGHVLVLYTDGVTEVLDPAGEEFGIERLAASLTGSFQRPPREVVANCVDLMRQFSAGVPAHDDVTLLVLRRSA